MDPQAINLNETIQKLNKSVLELLSERGKNIFFPKLGILSQSAQAKGKSMQPLAKPLKIMAHQCTSLNLTS
jgi:hypothetical protein